MSTTLDHLAERYRALETAANRAWWDAAVSGRESDYARLEEARNRIDALFRDRARFAELEAARARGADDPLEARAIELLWLEALPRQADARLSERINRLATGIERAFSTHRPVVGGRPRSTNDLEETLATSRDEAALEEAWEGLMSVGPLVAGRLLELVGLRNEAARAVGFADFHELRLALSEQTPDEIESFFDLLDERTAEPFADLKADVDDRLADRLGIGAGDLAPWHYENPFFQEVPDVFGAGLDAVYAGIDPVAAASRYYARLGLPVEAILERSSLHEAPGKDPHAFALHVDRAGDVRILLNLRANERWMGTTLHELGHAVYDAGIDRDLPWVLRRPAHTYTTEAIAMLFGRLSKRTEWMRSGGLVDDERAADLAGPARRELQGHMLVFARWAQVMVRFERALYRDPGDDPNDTWWRLKERYQGLRRPPRADGAADWAAKIHVVVAPVYYHNYLLGECLASQLHARLRTLADDGADPVAAGDPAVGAWLAREVFEPGARLRHDELVRSATGAPLSPEPFGAEFLSPVPD